MEITGLQNEDFLTEEYFTKHFPSFSLVYELLDLIIQQLLVPEVSAPDRIIPYLLQNLQQFDSELKVSFCQRIQENRNIVNCVLFADELILRETEYKCYTSL